jgi:transcription elongation GreA/GreB family factor
MAGPARGLGYPRSVSLRKADLKRELAAQLGEQLEAARRAHAAAVEGATHSEATPENDKDTRGLEQSYLARGQAQRVEELAAAVADVEALALRSFADGDPVGLGAVVTAEEGDARLVFFVAPHGGGSALAGGAVQAITPRSPLGKALVGKRVGDDGEVRLPGKVRELVIVAIE